MIEGARESFLFFPKTINPKKIINIFQFLLSIPHSFSILSFNPHQRRPDSFIITIKSSSTPRKTAAAR
jgi:hypothetical protein